MLWPRTRLIQRACENFGGASLDAKVFDERACFLGEGPLWHPLTGRLYWFDILAGFLFERDGSDRQEWSFGEPASAAGWIDADRLLVATASGLHLFNRLTGQSEVLADFPAGDIATRSNDGRADRKGGFWIGTMGLAAEEGAGAIYRMFRGEVRRLFDGLTIPNSIAFSPDGATAYFADTPAQVILRLDLDQDGWPIGEPVPHIDLSQENLNPDGSTVDAQGALWNAQWGAGRVARYLVDGSLDCAFDLPARHTSCPAFGGSELTTLFVTTAREGLTETGIATEPLSGNVFVLDCGFEGLPEPRVIL